MEEDGASQSITGLAFVEFGMATLPQIGIRQPLQGEEGAFDPSQRPQGARQGIAAARRGEFAQDDGRDDHAGLDGGLQTEEFSRHKTLDVLPGYVRDADAFKDHAGAAFL